MVKEKILLSPEVAEELLKNNYPLNRALSMPVVLKYADDIRAGRWNEEVSDIDQPLATDIYGRLIQGQHRCNAVIVAQKPIYTFIVRGVPEGYYEYLDGGFARSASTYLRTKNANRIAAISAAICAIEDGTLSLKSAVNGKVGSEKKNVFQASRKAQIEKYQNNKGMIDSLYAMSLPIQQKTHLSPSAVAIALYILLYTGEPESAIRSFSGDFATGPIEAANRLLVEFCFNMTKANKKHKRADDIAFVLHAYDHYRAGSHLKSFTKYSATFDKYEKRIQDKRATKA